MCMPKADDAHRLLYKRGMLENRRTSPHVNQGVPHRALRLDKPGTANQSVCLLQ